MKTHMKAAPIEGGGGIPPEPDWSEIFSDVLDVAAAHTEWGIVIREMRESQTVSVANGHAIARLVHFRLVYGRALRMVGEQGAILKAKRTLRPLYNLHWIVMRQADEAIRSAEAELGIAPVRRGKASKVNRAVKEHRAADAYLKRIGA